MFTIGKRYTKKQIYEILSVPNAKRDGAWHTGYRQYGDNIYIFVNIGVPGRTGDDYSNQWVGDILYWEAKNGSHIRQPLIKKLLNPEIHKLIFTRQDNNQPYIYQGLGFPIYTEDTSPVIIHWSFCEINEIDLDTEDLSGRTYIEGACRQITVNAYERNIPARQECIEHHGYRCKICGFNFKTIYGEKGEEYIHVHHIIPLSEIKSEYVLMPKKDLIPICANCHSILHRRKNHLSLEELKAIINPKYLNFLNKCE